MVARDEWHAQVLIGQSGLGTTEDMELFKEKVCLRDTGFMFCGF